VCFTLHFIEEIILKKKAVSTKNHKTDRMHSMSLRYQRASSRQGRVSILRWDALDLPITGRSGVSLPGNAVTLDFPPQAVDAPLELEIEVSVPENPHRENGEFRWLTVDVEPRDPTRAVAGHLRLAHPVTVTLDLTGFPAWMGNTTSGRCCPRSMIRKRKL
jgi:hypothetical protein